MIVVKLKSERSIVCPLTGKLYGLYGYRVDCKTIGRSDFELNYNHRGTSFKCVTVLHESG